MSMDFIEAMNELEREKGISKDVLFEAIEAALISSYNGISTPHKTCVLI